MRSLALLLASISLVSCAKSPVTNAQASITASTTKASLPHSIDNSELITAMNRLSNALEYQERARLEKINQTREYNQCNKDCRKKVGDWSEHESATKRQERIACYDNCETKAPGDLVFE